MWTQAAPFQVLSTAEMREDYRVSWESYGSVHGEVLPDGQVISVPGQGDVEVSSSAAMALHNAATNGGLGTTGVHLTGDAESGIRLEMPANVQGVGVVVEHLEPVAASFTVCLHSEAGELIGTMTLSAPSASVPLFLGIIDPEVAIRSVTVEASPAGRFAMAEPIFQLPADLETELAKLPTFSSVTVPILTNETFLHQGLDTRIATPQTSHATDDFANSLDLLTAFPSMRRGDIIRFDRIGLAFDGAEINQVLGVLSSTEVIEAGNELRRVPGALDVGPDFFTKKTGREGGSIETPTNINEDFLISESSFVTVPQEARFAFFSLAKPLDKANPLKVKVSLIQRAQFEDWAARKGLVGALAVSTSDLDGDGLSLLEEFVYLKDPTENDAESSGGSAGGFVPQQIASDPLALSFAARTGTEFRYLVEFSSDLDDWQSMEADASSVGAAGLSESAVFLASDPDAGESPVRRFGRVTIEPIVRNTP